MKCGPRGRFARSPRRQSARARRRPNEAGGAEGFTKRSPRRTRTTVPITAASGMGGSGIALASPRVKIQARAGERAITRCTMMRSPKVKAAMSPGAGETPHRSNTSAPAGMVGSMLEPPNRTVSCRRSRFQMVAMASSRAPVRPSISTRVADGFGCSTRERTRQLHGGSQVLGGLDLVLAEPGLPADILRHGVRGHAGTGHDLEGLVHL